MELLVTAIIIALVMYGLERNRARTPQTHPHLAGSTDIQNRDEERLSCELRSR
jgi:hypothetical protein